MKRHHPTLDQPLEPRQQRVWELVSRFPLRSLWNLQGIPFRTVASRTWKALFADNIFGIAAELGFYFFFSLFPTLFSAPASSLASPPAPLIASTRSFCSISLWSSQQQPLAPY